MRFLVVAVLVKLTKVWWMKPLDRWKQKSSLYGLSLTSMAQWVWWVWMIQKAWFYRACNGKWRLRNPNLYFHGPQRKCLSPPYRKLRSNSLAIVWHPTKDALTSKKAAVENRTWNRLRVWKGEKPAFKAWIPVPILLPGENEHSIWTWKRFFMLKIPLLTEKDGINRCWRFGWVYPWADEPRNHGVNNGHWW